MKTTTRVGVIIIIIIAIAAVFAFMYAHRAPEVPVALGEPIATAQYMCNAGNTITTAFYEGESTPAAGPGQPPTPGGSAVVDLSDGRTMTLAQTISADGARYANADESFVFWDKGNGALVLENNEEKTYVGCIKVVPEPQGQNLSKVYANSSEGFSVRYPEGFTVDESYEYQEMGPGTDISGIKFTIPASMATGTNLSSDSYISIEEIPDTQSCTADLFLDQGKAQAVTEGDSTYSFASSTGAGAGNRYEETVYALPGTNPCMAVRYYIHYGVIENYPEGAVKEFDKAALVNMFDAIRHTLTIVQ